jgi:hypothetical protein
MTQPSICPWALFRHVPWLDGTSNPSVRADIVMESIGLIWPCGGALECYLLFIVNYPIPTGIRGGLHVRHSGTNRSLPSSQVGSVCVLSEAGVLG